MSIVRGRVWGVALVLLGAVLIGFTVRMVLVMLAIGVVTPDGGPWSLIGAILYAALGVFAVTSGIRSLKRSRRSTGPRGDRRA